MKRRIFKLCLFLPLGAIINVALAWGTVVIPCHASLDAPMTYCHQDHYCCAVWELWQSAFVKRLNMALYTVSSKSDDATTMQRVEVDEVLPSGSLNQLFQSINRTMDIPKGASVISILDGWTIDQRGWPMRALWGGIQRKAQTRTVGEEMYGRRWIEGSFSKGPIQNYWSILLDRDAVFESGKASPTHSRILPLCPIWPGFAINTIFYAALLWLLFSAPFAVRRRLRIKRGLCPACAYPVGDSPVCTECGAAITMRDSRKPTAESPP